MCTRLMAMAMVVSLATLIGPARAGQLDPNLAGWWRFDDGAGTTAVDSSGQERHGELIGGPQWTAGMRKGALAFSGSSHVAIPGYDGIMGGHARTTAAWIKVENTSASIITWGPTGGGTKWVMRTHNGPASLRVECGQSQIIGTIDLADGQWHHTAAVLVDDGSPNVDEIKLYVDGVPDEISAVTPRLVNTSAGGDVQIAYDLNNSGRTFQGLIDDVRLYDRALEAQEIAAVMQDVGGTPTQAVSPEPRDGALVDGTWAALTWTPGDLAESHNLYVGTNFTDVNEATPQNADIYVGNQVDTTLFVGVPTRPYPAGLVATTTYYWRVDEVSPQAVLKGPVWSFTVPPEGPWKPVPADTARFVGPDSDLTWTAGFKAVMFGVHFGDDPDTVAQATGTGRVTVEPTFDPGPLEPGKTYYWRVDQFNGTAWQTGEVWKFTVALPGGGLKGEYFNNMDLLGAPVLTRIDPGIDMTLGAGSPEPNVVAPDGFSVRWRGEIEPAFSEVYTFYTRTDDGSRLWINDRLVLDKWLWVRRVVDMGGEPIALVAGQRYSLQMEWYNEDGDAEAHLFWESASQPKDIVPAAALTPPFHAGAPAPGRDAANVTQTPILAWSAGDYATDHELYFGDSADAVANATPASAAVYQGRRDLDTTTFDPGPLEWNKTYYWRVDEVNDAHPDSPWKGAVWSFTTADFLVVDDFESYTDQPDEEIFSTWIDGYTDGLSGSTVGYLTAANGTFGETAIVHGGRQAMPLRYDNTSPPYLSQAERTWTKAQDWTVQGVQTLTLYFRGDAANTEATPYVILKDSASRTGTAVYPDAAAILGTTWQQWDIPLSIFSSAGANLKAVKSLSVGVGNPKAPAPGGTGQVYLDDIRARKQ
jgi:hypothetical protein